jgi:hypothetical protein
MNMLEKSLSTPMLNKCIAMVVNVDDDNNLCHFCLDHTNYGSLRGMKHLYLAEGVP